MERLKLPLAGLISQVKMNQVEKINPFLLLTLFLTIEQVSFLS